MSDVEEQTTENECFVNFAVVGEILVILHDLSTADTSEEAR